MEKILILADFDAGAPFLRELAALSSDRAVIISADERLFAPASSAPSSEIYAPSAHSAPGKRALASGLAHSGFTAYFADPARADLVAGFCSSDLQIVYILLNNERSVRLAYDAVRAELATVPIAIVSNDAAYANDSFCSAFSPRAMVAARLVDELPSTPHIARFIGAGAGEIMQLKVPAGSIYANKHIHAITQRDYKIALIYRKGAAILPTRARLILPGDELLLVGEPARLRKIFERMRATVGQFPQPYANDVAAIIDMKIEQNPEKIISAALWLQEKTNASRCDFLIINACAGEQLDFLRAKKAEGIAICFAHELTSVRAALAAMSAEGSYLFIASREGYEREKLSYFKAHVPLLRLGSGDFTQLHTAAALSENASGIEELSGVLLDFGGQCGLKSEVWLYDLNLPKSAINSLLEHADEQSKFFGRKLTLQRFERANPLLTMSADRGVVCVAGFSEQMAKSGSVSAGFARFLRPKIGPNMEQLARNYLLLLPMM